jgi:lysyl-tRNA synthetase class II
MDSLSSQEEYVHSTVHRDYRDFLAALKVGLPFCTGMGLSLSRLAQVLASYEDIRATEWWET